MAHEDFLFLVNLECSLLLNEKYSQLLTKNFIRDDIYYKGTVNILVLMGLIPIIILITSLCKRRTLLISIELPQKVTP